MNDAVCIIMVSEELVTDLTRLFSDADRLVEDCFPRRIGLDVMNDQHVGHACSDDEEESHLRHTCAAGILRQGGRSTHQAEY